MAVDAVLSEDVLICSAIRLRQKFSFPSSRQFLLCSTIYSREKTKSGSFPRNFHTMTIVLCTSPFTFTGICFLSFQRELDIVFKPCVMVVTWGDGEV
jgi:hypothetical protein